MKIELKNGSTIESIENTSVGDTVRGRRSKYIVYAEPKLKFRYRMFNYISSTVNGLFARLHKWI